MDKKRDQIKWSKYADKYDPIKIGSIDGEYSFLLLRFPEFLERLSNSFFMCDQISGTDTFPHDNGLIRAINSNYKPNNGVVGNPKYTIFIGRLHLKTDEVQHQ